jgi:hypothetical protein
VKLLPDNSVYSSSADKNQRNSKNTKNWKELSKKEVNDYTVLEWGSQRTGTYIYMKSYLPYKVNFNCNYKLIFYIINLGVINYNTVLR